MGLLLNKPQCACKPLRFARIGIERSIQKKSPIIAHSTRSRAFASDSSHTLNSRAPFEFHRRAARGCFLRKADNGTAPFAGGSTREPAGECEVTARRQPI